jgi:Methyltransferase domain
MTANNENIIENFLSIMVENGAYSTIANLRFKLEQLFKNIDFKGKNLLEIGGGYGLFSLYAAVNEAKKVIILEPEYAGSTTGVINQFNILRDKLRISNIDLLPITFQDYNPMDIKFDIILLNDSINHLEEDACINLRTDINAWNIYKKMMCKISSLSNVSAKIIICDCSNQNLYPSLGLKNPIDNNIEWHKHQSPKIWSKLLKECGFSKPVISWTTFNRFGRIGKFILGNKFVSYFLTSHFCLKMEKN